ncbi:MAG: arginase family protein [Lachnospiraceae bacterium]|nr:arginase family protein [Lachnospiraceae bacterium]
MNITCFDFSGIYESLYEGFSREAESPRFLWRETAPSEGNNNIDRYLVECREIRGTNAYCDAAAEAELRKRIQAVPEMPAGIHFLDNGNYHYLSALITEKITIPYVLVLIDHHPDLRAPAFGDVLSCGSWVLRALQTQPLLQCVVMLGVDEDLLAEELEASGMQERIVREIPEGLPVYLSIDKDVLSVDEINTNWDQGEMRLAELLALMQSIGKAHRVIGVDICGEPAPGADPTQSAAVNAALVNAVLSVCG